MLVEVDDLRALLKSEQNVEIRPLAAVERDALLDVISDASTFLAALENDAYGEWSLADYRLIRFGYGDEIWKIYDISPRRRAPFANDNRVKGDLHGAAAVFAFEVGLAQEPIERDIFRAVLRRRPEHGRVGERPQHDRARASLGLLRRR